VVCASHLQMYEFMGASDAVITGGSTLAFEAIALGVMPILFESPSAFSASSFTPFEQACFIVNDGRQLRRAIDSTLSDDALAIGKRQHWPDIVREVFGDARVDPGPQFLAALAATVAALERSDAALRGDPAARAGG
jgi:hypothetical protein